MPGAEAVNPHQVTPRRRASPGLAIGDSLEVGLFGYVFTNALARADDLAREMQVGLVARHSFGPFGGVKQRGIGREGGQESLNSYSMIKTILRSSARV